MRFEIKKHGFDGVWLYETAVHDDERGLFTEWFHSREFQPQLPMNFEVAQGNFSVSKKGVIRGIHFSLAKVGQLKWITCSSGAVWDVVVDIRPNSKTFGSWSGIELRAGEGKSLLISQGFGHGFQALEENTCITYLVSSPYSSLDEFAINPNDPEIGISWPIPNQILSKRDNLAPTLVQMKEIIVRHEN